MRRDGESSVEDILESIKKVMARDNVETAVVDRLRRESTGFKELPEQAGQAPEPDLNDVLDLGEAGEVVMDDDFEDEDPAQEPVDEAELISEDVRSSMRESFAALSILAEPPAKPQIVRSGETSLEGLVRETIRPMLAEWLDQNLPAIVERMVAREIARIAGKKG